MHENLVWLSALVVVGQVAAATPAPAQTEIIGTVEPAIWIDPDGCMHWIADGGFEGFAEHRVDPHTGRPQCLHMSTCEVMDTDALFLGDSATLSDQGRATVEQFFRSEEAFAYGIYGHTDSSASEEDSIRISAQRAAAVAGLAQSMNVRVARQGGYGARLPAAPNTTAANMQLNRRVEIVCYR